MKTKLIVLFISLMLLTTMVAAATPMTNIGGNTSSKTKSTSASLVDVPVWEVGDTWTYQIDDISVDFTTETQTIQLDASIQELPLEVTDTTGEFYTLTFETTMDGQGYINANPDAGPVNISVTFTSLQIKGTLHVEKATLGVKDIVISFDKQKFTLNIIDQPFITLPSWLHIISAKMTANIDITCDHSLTILSFPLLPGISWDLIATNFSVDGQLQSPLFNLLNFINKIADLFGITLLPPNIAALLPVIDVGEALTMYLGSNVFQIPSFENALFCPNTETVHVPAGTYLAYNISLLDGLGYCYYAPDAGNVIKLTGNFQDLVPFVKSINMVLTNTTYS